MHKKHKHENCEEIYYIISGGGIAGAGGATEEIGAGHFHYVPADTEHWLANESADEPIVVIGWYLGAGNVAATGYVYMGDVTEADLQGPHKGYDVGSLVNHADVAPSDMSGIAGWSGAEFRACLGAAHGIGHSTWRPVLADGQALKTHRHNNADEYYLVVSVRAEPASAMRLPISASAPACMCRRERPTGSNRAARIRWSPSACMRARTPSRRAGSSLSGISRRLPNRAAVCGYPAGDRQSRTAVAMLRIKSK